MIQRVNAIAKSEGMDNITITSKTGELLYDSALLAGVEDEEEYVFVNEEDQDQDNNEQAEAEPEADEVDPNEIYKDADNENPTKPDTVDEAPESESDEESIKPTLRRSTRNVGPPDRLELDCITRYNSDKHGLPIEGHWFEDAELPLRIIDGVPESACHSLRRYRRHTPGMFCRYEEGMQDYLNNPAWCLELNDEYERIKAEQMEE